MRGAVAKRIRRVMKNAGMDVKKDKYGVIKHLMGVWGDKSKNYTSHQIVSEYKRLYRQTKRDYNKAKGSN